MLDAKVVIKHRFEKGEIDYHPYLMIRLKRIRERWNEYRNLLLFLWNRDTGKLSLRVVSIPPMVRLRAFLRHKRIYHAIYATKME